MTGRLLGVLVFGFLVGLVLVTEAETQRFGAWAEGRAKVKALVIVNEMAGSVGVGGRAALLAALAGLDVGVTKTVSNLDALSSDDAVDADLVIVLGGDGTASKAAATLGAGPPLLLLPGGTRNLLPHALCGALAWPQALRAAITRGRVARLTGAEANGRKFFVAAMFGATTMLARAREDARRGRFDLMVSRLNQVFTRIFSRRLAIRAEGGVATRVEAVGALCPAYRGEIEADALEWVQLNATKVLDFVRVSVRSVIGGWREDESIALSLARGGEIRGVGAIAAVLDGEPTTFEPRVRVRMLSEGPRVIVVR